MGSKKEPHTAGKLYRAGGYADILQNYYSISPGKIKGVNYETDTF